MLAFMHHGLRSTSHPRSSSTRPVGPPLALACVAMAVAGLAGCGPTVTFVEPGVVAAGATITISGTGFVEGASVRLEQDGGPVQLRVQEATGATISARVPAATPAGIYDVVVDVGGAEGRLEDAIEIRAGELRVRFLDVGQGDSTLLIGPEGDALLIDGGPRDRLAVVRAAVADVDLRAVAVTHTDADHLGGVVDLLAGLDGQPGTTDDLVPETRWIGHDNASCDSNLCDDLRGLTAQFRLPDIGETLDLGGPVVEVIGRDGVFGQGPVAGVTDPNERSLALIVSFGGRKVFIGGDLTGGGLDSVNVEQVAALEVGPVDVLRANHHGSATSSSQGFLSALQPGAVVLSVGTDNAFCHPEVGVLGRLTALSVPLYATGEGIVGDGARCDGTTPWPTQAAHGLGTFDLVISADGALDFE